MGVLEICLLAAGAVVFILSFLIPAGKEAVTGETKGLAQDEIKKLVSQEMSEIKGHVEDVVGEAIDYAVEKTERSLERLSNEKIMAVNEYSDTVLQEIHKNHEEVVFLYDMLNEKQTSLKQTVAQVNEAVKSVEETRRSAEAIAESICQASGVSEKDAVPESSPATVDAGIRGAQVQEEAQPGEGDLSVPDEADANSAQPEVSSLEELQAAEETPAGNDRILILHRRGWSTVEIAKELGLGVGEVKLVIDLYHRR